jgi:hypothetical protein
MRLTFAFSEEYRSAGRPRVHLERVLAVERAFLTVSALAAIPLDPTEPTRLRGVTCTARLLYAFYGLIVLVCVHRSGRLTPLPGRVLHGLDIAWSRR